MAKLSNALRQNRVEAPSAQQAIEVLKVHQQLRVDNAQLSTSLQSLREEVNSRREDIHTAATRQTEIEKQLKSIADAVEKQKNDFAELDEKVNTHDTNVGQLRTASEKCTAEVNELKKRLDDSDRSNAFKLDELSSQMLGVNQKLEQKVARHDGLVTGAENLQHDASQMKRIEQQVIDLRDDLDELAAKLKDQPVRYESKDEEETGDEHEPSPARVETASQSLQQIQAGGPQKDCIVEVSHSVQHLTPNWVDIRYDHEDLDMLDDPRVNILREEAHRDVDLQPPVSGQKQVSGPHRIAVPQRQAEFPEHIPTHNQHQQPRRHHRHISHQHPASRQSERDADMQIFHTMMDLRQGRHEEIMHYHDRFMNLMEQLPEDAQLHNICINRFVKGVYDLEARRFIHAWMIAGQENLKSLNESIVLLSRYMTKNQTSQEQVSSSPERDTLGHEHQQGIERVHGTDVDDSAHHQLRKSGKDPVRHPPNAPKVMTRVAHAEVVQHGVRNQQQKPRRHRLQSSPSPVDPRTFLPPMAPNPDRVRGGRVLKRSTIPTQKLHRPMLVPSTSQQEQTRQFNKHLSDRRMPPNTTRHAQYHHDLHSDTSEQDWNSNIN